MNKGNSQDLIKAILSHTSQSTENKRWGDEKEWLKMREIKKKKTVEVQDFEGYVRSLISGAFGANSNHLTCALGLNHDAVIAWLEEQKIKMSYVERNPKKHPLYIVFRKNSMI